MKIAVPMFVRESDKKILEAAAPQADFYYGKEPEKLAEAEVILGNVKPALLAGCKSLKWLQLNSAGADAYCKPGILPENVLLTNSTGAYGQALSEHMLALLLAMMKKLYRYHDNQKAHQWKDEGMVTSLEDATVVVVGFGNIGRAFGRLCKLLGAHVIGIRRHQGAVPAEADEMGTLEDLPSVLARADVVASVLPGTPATTHLYDANAFAAMKAGGLVHQLRPGQCSGAGRPAPGPSERAPGRSRHRRDGSGTPAGGQPLMGYAEPHHHAPHQRGPSPGEDLGQCGGHRRYQPEALPGRRTPGKPGGPEDRVQEERVKGVIRHMSYVIRRWKPADAGRTNGPPGDLGSGSPYG